MQHTLKKSYTFSGKGLHTGAPVSMTMRPAATGSGIRFVRTDIGPDATVRALASNVDNTSRSTALTENGASVVTIEHLMSAAAGLGVDNMLVELSAAEVPILDGSALPYVQAITADGLQEQNATRKYLGLKEPFRYSEEGGASIEILPSGESELRLRVDFNSKVLGVQNFTYNSGVDYSSQIAPCRTFCFLHELQFLLSKGLIKGGDMDNAIVIVENLPDEATLQSLKSFFGLENLEVKEGYLSNLQLHFPDEIVRHKMLDMIGDFALLGAPFKGTIIASKTGHRVNTEVCKKLLETNLLYTIDAD